MKTRINGAQWCYILTDCDPNWNVSSTAEIRYKDHGNHVTDLVATRDEPRETRRDLESFLYCCDHRVYVARAQRLLKRHQERKEKYKHLKVSIEQLIDIKLSPYFNIKNFISKSCFPKVTQPSLDSKLYV